MSVEHQHKLNHEKWNPKGLERSMSEAKSAKQRKAQLYFSEDRGLKPAARLSTRPCICLKSRGVAVPEPARGLFCVFLLSVAVGNLSIRSGVFRVLGRSSEDLRFRVAGCPGCQASAGFLGWGFKLLVVPMFYNFYPRALLAKPVLPEFHVRGLAIFPEKGNYCKNPTTAFKNT
ncbi:hypothetical protein B0J18DRAFT_287625 [Chaetomium sp. MPI-SDFR-AT-0129]|nr:hypothetical protein B0J18DRAFT_287625 [Chaetomium sp. MPI-SDFR-AT-0129]